MHIPGAEPADGLTQPPAKHTAKRETIGLSGNGALEGVVGCIQCASQKKELLERGIPGFPINLGGGR